MRTVLLHTDVQEEDDGRDPIDQRMFLRLACPICQLRDGSCGSCTDGRRR